MVPLRSVRFLGIAGALLSCFVIGGLRADVLVLEDGTIYRGEVQKQTVRTLVFRAEIDGRWTDLSIDASRIKDLFEEPGNQADRDSSPATPELPAALPPSMTGTQEEASESRGSTAVRAPHIARIPLAGQVGGLIDGSVSGTFDVDLLRHCLDLAAEEGASAVILDLSSSGGFLTAMEDICELIIARQEDQRIICFANEALSAAAIIALTCRELVVRPEARVGAAVMVQESGGGLTAVDAKLASPHHARQRQFMEASGRPYPLLAAMTIQETKLWWSPEAGLFSDPAEAERHPEATLVDGESTVLTMLAGDAVRWHVATEARDLPELAARLGPSGAGGSLPIVDYAPRVLTYNEGIDRRLAVVREQFRRYFQSLSRLYDNLGEQVDVARSADSRRSRRLQSELRELLDQAEAAGQTIKSQDRRLLTRRADIPGGLIDQIDADEEALSSARRLSHEQTISALNQARRTIQTILEAWRSLMTVPDSSGP